jgi:[ribosomal protein S5]-alanine N-acetyltransferase
VFACNYCFISLLSKKDAPAIFEQYAQDEEVTKYMTWRSHSNIKTTQKFLAGCISEMTAKTACYWMILPKQENKAVGMIRLQYQNHRAELGYVLARPYWSQGFMTEALQPIGQLGIGSTQYLSNLGSM